MTATATATRVVPASVGQASLWFLRDVMPCKTPYNTGVQFRLIGELDTDALTRAFGEVVRRHESLRTTFRFDSGVVQVIAEGGSPDVRLVDLSTSPDPEDGAKRLGREVNGEAFDLEHGPLLRIRLARIAPREHVMIAVMDHIIADGMSLDILWRELGTIYRAFRAGEPSPLPPPKHQYADWVLAHEEWRKTPAFARQLAYWKEHLAGSTPCELPEDFPRPPVKSYRGGFASAPIPGELMAPLRALAGKENVSLFSSLLAVLKVLLARYSGQADMLVMIPIACRQRFAMDDVIGFFSNMVVLRTDIADDVAFREVLQRVNKEVMNGVFRQDVPFEKVVEAIQPERSLAHDPLARICLSFLPAGGAALDLPGVDARFSELANGGAKFDLHLTITEHDDYFGCIAEYNSDIFAPETIDQILRHYRRLLASVVAEPSLTVGKLPLLETAERKKILVDWNDTARPLPDVATAHELFERQADRAPERTAVVFGDQSLTYAELERRANQVAHHLAAMGVAPRAVVGVFIDRSAEMVVSLLGVLKAGATYVPIDPEYPIDRIALMIEDSKLGAVITTSRLLDRLPKATPALAFDRDADAEALAARPTTRPASPFPHTPGAPPTDAPCYIIYTSGSTGRPKGVLVHHRGLVNFVASMTRAPGMVADDTILAVVTLSFDMAGYELWLPLSVGAKIVVAAADQTSDGDALRRLIEKHGATAMQATPATFRLLLAAGWPGSKSFKAVSGGEPFPPPLAAQMLERLGSVWNGYGPTETTVYSTCVELKQSDRQITIGRPIDNTAVYVLDPRGEPVPVGVLGELVIGGTGVTHGYLDRPELTGSRFVPDPFSPVPNARMYKTGDLVAFRADGQIVYNRRLDHQVKVRGYRIELGEIESVLAAHDAIDQTVVVVREDRSGDARLVAYYVPHAGRGGVAVGDLRAHLRQRLPEYMIPQHFIELAALPLTPVGKVDRKALPAPQAAERANDARVPTSPSELLVAKIWAEVLGHDRIAAGDNFFDLGGHSLLSMMVVARIRSETGASVSPRDLLLSSLEQIAAQLPSAAAPRPLVKTTLKRLANDVTEAPASFGQRRLFYLDQLDPGQPIYNVNVGLWLRGTLDLAALQRAVDGLVERHAVLRSSLTLEATGLVQHIAPSLAVPIDEIHLDAPTDAEARCREILAERAARPFDLTRGPLFRAALVHVGPERHCMLASFHHVVIDGWSLDVFERELLALYNAAKRGESAGSTLLPALPIQYADYAAWQQQADSDPAHHEHVAYWKESLKAPLPVLELPFANTRPQTASAGDWESTNVPVDLVESLGALARREGATLFMVLVAAYATLLSRVSGQEDVVVGTPIANRSHAETLNVLGFFANTLALRVDLRGAPTFRELLRRVREVSTQAYVHQETPFAELVQVLEIGRDPSRTPIYQTLFSFEEPAALGGAATLPNAASAADLRLERREYVLAKIARTDLAVWAKSSADGLQVTVEYPTAIFDAENIRSLLEQFQVLLRAVARDAETKVDMLPLLSSEDRQRILVEWNRTEKPLPEVAAAHQLFERRVDAGPERTAVVFRDKSLSYAELEQRANRLAHHLAGIDIAPRALVGVFLERSAEMVVALLAVLKAGATYVPIDPEYPADRIAMMIEDSKLATVITTTGLLDRLPEGARARAVALDRDLDAKAIAARPASRPAWPMPHAAGAPPSDAPCYVIYTSGSTGRPKGVVVHHRALVNFLASMAHQPGLSAEDTLVAVTTLSFDIAGLELHLPLSVGAKVVIAGADDTGDGDALRRLVEGSGITVMQATPSTWRLLLGAGWKGSKSFKALCGGEAFPPPLAAEMVERIGQVWNMYGPTETTIWSTCTLLSAEDARITIGRPIDNTTIYVLDPKGEPVPNGIPGELIIGGTGVSHGYLDRAELTASRFVHDPFSSAAGAKMYKTGDLAAFRADGKLVYHRRLDHQVKVRGYRIELGEIESVLAEHESIDQTVVIVREDRPGDARLVAYYVPKGGKGALTATDLRKHLRKRLPDYMIPQHFMDLPAMPLTPAGKIDRKGLPAPQGVARAETRAPSSPSEVVLSKIWAEALGHDRIGASDNFFDLGGHSLLSMIVIAKIRSETGAIVGPRDLLMSSLEQIATQLPGGARPAAAGAPATAARPAAAPPPVPPEKAKGLVGRLRSKLFG